MQKRNAIHLILVTLLMPLSVSSFADESALRPFWRAKPKVFKKVTDERQIVVSVNAEKLSTKSAEGNTSILRMEGGGLVKADAQAVYSEAQKYNELKEVSEHVLEVRVGPSPQDLFLHTAAFNYHARMTMRVTPEVAGDGVRHLRFVVIEGNFKGMKGEFSFVDYADSHQKGALMGFHAEYKYKVLPMPQFFVEFGLEVVLQRVASRMRSFLEDKLKPKNLSDAASKN